MIDDSMLAQTDTFNRGEKLYDGDRLREAATIVRELCVHPSGTHEGILVARWRHELWLEFAVLSWCCGEGLDNEGRIVSAEQYEHMFHGDGPSGNLRELRHTFWGDPTNSGYIFYPSGKLIEAAFAELREWFDV